MSRKQQQGAGNVFVVMLFVGMLLYLLPANLFWYVLSVTGFCEPYYNGIVEALICPYDASRFFNPLSWGPFIFDCVFSTVAWLGVFKVCGVKL